MGILGGGGGSIAGQDHGLLSGLLDDDHTIYLLLAGRAAGQFIGVGTPPTGGTFGDVGVQSRLSIGRAGGAFTTNRAFDSYHTISVVGTTIFNSMEMDLTASGDAGAAVYNLLKLSVPTTFGSSLTSGGMTGVLIDAVYNGAFAAGTAGNTVQGIAFNLSPVGTGGFSSIIGVDLLARGSIEAATGTSIIGFKSGVHALASIVTNAIAVQAAGSSGSYTGTTAQATAFDVGASFMNSATVTTWSGLRISTGITAAIPNKWSLDLTNISTNMGSRVAHKVALGWNPATVAAITARLMLAAGTATAGTAPLKSQSGPLLTAVEAGASEHYLDGFYVTPTTTVARQQIATDLNMVCADGDVVTYDDEVVLV